MMEKFLQVILEMDDFMNRPAIPNAVEDIEIKLGFHLSNEYVEYLSAYSIVSFDGHEFTGSIDSNRLNVVKATERFWSRVKFEKQNMYVVEELGIDGLVILQNSDGEVFRASIDEKPMKINTSILEYICGEKEVDW